MKMKVIFKEDGYKLIVKYKSGGTMKGLFTSPYISFDFENLDEINEALSTVTGFISYDTRNKMKIFIHKSLRHIEL